MGKLNLFYIVSARSSLKSRKGRKITSILAHWKKKNIELYSFFGGDLRSEKTKKNIEAGRYKKVAIRNVQIDRGFVINTISEIRDILHDVKLYVHLIRQKNKPPNIVWERSNRLHFLSLLYAKQRKAIYVHEWIDNLLTLYKYSAFKWLGHIVENIKKKRSDFIVVPNGVIKDNLVEEGINPDKIKVAYNAVDTSIFYPKPKSNVSEEFTVLYIGSYAFYHDMERLPKAIKILQDKVPNNKILFKFVGDGIHLDGTKQLCNELNLKNVEFLGRVGIDKVPDCINEADLCVLPGTTDIICPIKIMEFMGCGKTVLLPDYKCNREVITDGYDGITFKPFDEKSLADKIIWSHENKEELRKIGDNAEKTCISRFTWETTWGATLEEIINTTKLS